MEDLPVGQMFIWDCWNITKLKNKAYDADLREMPCPVTCSGAERRDKVLCDSWPRSCQEQAVKWLSGNTGHASMG